MTEINHNNFMVEINGLKVEMAEMRSDMRHLADTMNRLQAVLEAASPRGEVKAIEERNEKRFATIEEELQKLIDLYQNTRGALWAVNVFWGILLVAFEIYWKVASK